MIAREEPQPRQTPAPPRPDAADRAFTCLFCGAPMAGGHCKLRCPQCGYIEDCSDLFRADTRPQPRDGRVA